MINLGNMNYMGTTKFRALDGDNNRWVYLELINADAVCYLLDEDGKKYQDGTYLNELTLSDWQQFTGLFDKNCEEIYTGDIVNLVWGRESKFIDGGIENQIEIPCIFKRGIMGINNWYPHWGDLLFKPTVSQKEFKRLTKCLSCQFDAYGNQWEREIIGNILENLKLINL